MNQQVRPDLDRATVEEAYAKWAPVYDQLCGPLFWRARRAAARAAQETGGRVLEVGVGTGLSFGDYSAPCRLVGVDISEPMVEKARHRLRSGRYPHVEAVRVMDAEALEFGEAEFDVVVAQFVITLVSDPERALSEFARVVRPGGQIILVNHLFSEAGAAAAVESWAASRVRKFGLRPDFPFSRLADWARAHGGVSLVERRPIRPFFTLVSFRRAAAN